MTTTPNVPETVQELLDLQVEQATQEEVNFLELACKCLIKCTAHENSQVAEVILESLRDWHVEQSKEEGNNPTPWLVDATRLDLALKTLKLVRWD